MHMEPERENEHQLEPEILTTQVFSNELIWKTLGPCLNTSDLQCCRLVNKTFNRMVIDKTEFRNRVVVKVRKELLEPKELGTTDEKWKRISLQFPAEKVSDPANYTWLFPLLEQVNFLSLSLHKRKSVYQINFHPLVGQLLSTCTKLKTLAMEPDFIRYGSGGIFPGNKTLKNLQELEILEPTYRWTDFGGPFSDYEDQGEEKEYELATEFCKSLKSVKIYKSYFVPIKRNPDVGVDEDDPFLQAVMKSEFLWHVCKLVVKNNRKHIESHPFYDVYQLQPEALLNVAGDDAFRSEYVWSTPALKSLLADASQMVTSIYNFPNMYWPFLMYLLSRRPLNQVEVSFPVGGLLNHSVCITFINFLFKSHPSLKTLRLRSDLLQTVLDMSDWSPIRQSNLVELCLEDLTEPQEQDPKLGHSDWIKEIISSLPGSIRRIYLKGAVGLRAKRKLKIQDFSSCNPNLVAELSILNAGGSLTNEVAQFICKNFQMLRRFHLSGCKTDDHGFLGISELKGLQFLTLKGCRISNKSLGEMAFKELRYFEISDNPNVTLTGIKGAMRQCPSLETLIMPKQQAKFTKENGQKICPRLKCLMQ